MKNYDFLAKKKIAFIIALVVFALGVVSFIIRGFNFDIDFAGGNEMTVTIGKSAEEELSNVRKIVADVIGDNQISSIAKSGSNNQQVIIRTVKLTNDDTDKVFAALKEAYSLTATAPDALQSVGSTVSGDTRKTAFISSGAAILLILIYITFRFQFASGLSSIVCLIFNIFTMLTFYSLLQIPLNSNVIAACLTILGYSINATIVIFDRVRENNKKSGDSFDANANSAIHQTLARSINTTVTTLLTIGMVYILGVESIRNFALPLIIGIVAGLFSSIFLGCPLWGIFNKVFTRKKSNAKSNVLKKA